MSSTSAPLLPNATIVDRSDLTESIACFRIRSDAAPVAFVPGQYVTVGLGVDERLVQRPYSIASSARRLDDGYELYVRLVPGGALTPHLFRTRPGERVGLRTRAGPCATCRPSHVREIRGTPDGRDGRAARRRCSPRSSRSRASTRRARSRTSAV